MCCANAVAVIDRLNIADNAKTKNFFIFVIPFLILNSIITATHCFCKKLPDKFLYWAVPYPYHKNTFFHVRILFFNRLYAPSFCRLVIDTGNQRNPVIAGTFQIGEIGFLNLRN